MGRWHGTVDELVAPEQTAVLVVDVQRAFTAISELYPPLDEMLPRLAAFVDAARTAGALVVNIRIVVPAETYSSNWQCQFAPDFQSLMAPDQSGVAFHPGFEPQPGDLTLTKHRYSAFVSTPLTAILHTRGIHTVITCGLTTDVCVGSTARDAWQRDFQVITLADCTAEVTQAQHEAGLATLAMNFGLVCSSREVVDVWQHHGARPR